MGNAQTALLVFDTDIFIKGGPDPTVLPATKKVFRFLQDAGINFGFASPRSQEELRKDVAMVMNEVNLGKEEKEQLTPLFVLDSSSAKSTQIAAQTRYYDTFIPGESGFLRKDLVHFASVRKLASGVSSKRIYIVTSQITSSFAFPPSNIIWCPSTGGAAEDLLDHFGKLNAKNKRTLGRLGRLPSAAVPPHGCPICYAAPRAVPYKPPSPAVAAMKAYVFARPTQARFDAPRGLRQVYTLYTAQPPHPGECKCRGACAFYRKCGQYTSSRAFSTDIINGHFINARGFIIIKSRLPRKYVFYCGCVCGVCQHRPCLVTCSSINKSPSATLFPKS